MSCSPNTVQCLAHIWSYRSPNDLYFFFFFFFSEKLSQFTTTFMFFSGRSSDGSIFVLFRQEDKDFHQVKSWPPTQQLVIKSIILNFSL